MQNESKAAQSEQRGFPRELCECECHDLGDCCYSCFVAHTNYDEWQLSRSLKGNL